MNRDRFEIRKELLFTQVTTNTGTQKHSENKVTRRKARLSELPDSSTAKSVDLVNQLSSSLPGNAIFGTSSNKYIVSAWQRHNTALLFLNCRPDNYGSSKNVGLSKEFGAPSGPISCSLLCCYNSFPELWSPWKSPTFLSKFILEAFFPSGQDPSSVFPRRVATPS